MFWVLTLTSGHDSSLHNWIVIGSCGWNHVLFCSMDKWSGFVFCLCSLTSLPHIRPSVLNNQTSPSHGIISLKSVVIILALVFKVCTYDVSMKLIVVYIKNPRISCTLVYIFLSVWLWINYWWGRTKINNYLFKVFVLSLQEDGNFKTPVVKHLYFSYTRIK